MKKAYFLLLPLVCSVPVLIGCSSLMGSHQTPSQSMQSMHIEPLLSINNSDRGARGFYQLGRYFQGQNRLQQAEDAYRHALAMQADYIDAQNALGVIYSAQGKFDEAIAEFHAILAKTPELARIHNNLGYTFYLQGNYADAVTAFDKAIALEPNNPRALNNLSLAHQKLGEPEKSQLALARASVLTLLKTATQAMHRNIAANTAISTAPNTDGNISLPALTSGESVRLESPAQLASTALDPQDHAFETVASEAPQVLSVAVVSNAMFSVRPLSTSGGATRQPEAFNFEIANGNGVAALARKAADTLMRNGFPSPRLANLKPFQQNRTVIRYRDGFYYDATRIGHKLAATPLLVLDPHMRKNTDVQLVLGKDAITQIALFGPDSQKTASVSQRPAIRALWPTTAAEILAASIPQGF